MTTQVPTKLEQAKMLFETAKKGVDMTFEPLAIIKDLNEYLTNYIEGKIEFEAPEEGKPSEEEALKKFLIADMLPNI
jgi:hypothetical protein